MYLHFLFRLLYSGVVFVIVYWLVMLVPAGLGVLFGNSRIAPFTYLLSNVIAAYALCLWPAFCATIAHSSVGLPETDHKWAYYVTAALFGLIGTIASLRFVLKDPKWEPGKVDDAFIARSVGINRIRGYFLMIATLSLLVFLTWPRVAVFLYGWALCHVM